MGREMFTRVFTQENLGQPQPYHMLSRNILNLMDSVCQINALYERITLF